MFAAAAVYKGRLKKLTILLVTIIRCAFLSIELYGNPDGSVPATFQIIYMIGWKPDPSQPKPLERGTGEVSLKDIYRLDEVVKEASQKGILPREDDEKNR
jgi:NADH dehydrogenase [ubiquinone] 1 alpha subcomplex assembly factor 5